MVRWPGPVCSTRARRCGRRMRGQRAPAPSLGLQSAAACWCSPSKSRPRRAGHETACWWSKGLPLGVRSGRRKHVITPGFGAPSCSEEAPSCSEEAPRSTRRTHTHPPITHIHTSIQRAHTHIYPSRRYCKRHDWKDNRVANDRKTTVYIFTIGICMSLKSIQSIVHFRLLKDGSVN
jgi:hypothetical protein